MDVAARADRVRARVADAGCDVLVVTRLPNVRYLTGFTGSAGVVLVMPDELVLLTDGRYTTQSREQLDAAGVTAEVDIVASSALQFDRIRSHCAPGTRVGLEAHGVTWAQQRGFADALAACSLVATEEVVEGLRRVKESGEVARIRAACAIADDALQATLPMLADRPTEQQFALALEVGMRERGASGTSFDSIVASGPNGAMPHARPSARPIEPGELVVIDFGCIVDGYCSDMTRTVSLGDPGPDARRLWDVVRESQNAGRAAVAEGVACAAVDRASRAVIDDAGWGELFSHGTGHGVGLEIHEAPRVAKTASGTLDRGVVVTVEPGVYLPGVGGVRLEDTVVVTSTGADALTEFPKTLLVEA
ncbi:MAG TPA: aminopeptidase P family protein [Acidimicrobiia bacterium]|nr:aminopeptidase P family protein [Acidimicrobiia bacterium]